MTLHELVYTYAIEWLSHVFNDTKMLTCAPLCKVQIVALIFPINPLQ